MQSKMLQNLEDGVATGRKIDREKIAPNGGHERGKKTSVVVVAIARKKTDICNS
jgi:hypothetical protein